MLPFDEPQSASGCSFSRSACAPCLLRSSSLLHCSSYPLLCCAWRSEASRGAWRMVSKSKFVPKRHRAYLEPGSPSQIKSNQCERKVFDSGSKDDDLLVQKSNSHETAPRLGAALGLLSLGVRAALCPPKGGPLADPEALAGCQGEGNQQRCCGILHHEQLVGRVFFEPPREALAVFPLFLPFPSSSRRRRRTSIRCAEIQFTKKNQ